MARTDHRAPWWVRALTTGGRPAVAVIVMTMCSPGEHHLGHLAGWETHLAWGMAAVLAAYAGIATVVASNRPTGARGKRSAVAGAWISLAAAMAAQPVSHLFVTGWLSATPRAPWLLVVLVSCAPPLALGHLLHLAATPVSKLVEQDEQAPELHIDHQPLHLVPAVSTPPALPMSNLLTVADVMRLKGCSRATITRWQNKGLLTIAAKDASGANLYDARQIP